MYSNYTRVFSTYTCLCLCSTLLHVHIRIVTGMDTLNHKDVIVQYKPLMYVHMALC